MIVEAKDTAIAMGSGDLEVFATPSMVALMESAAMGVAAPLCGVGQTTVGVKIDVAHTRATPVGAVVGAVAKLTNQDGRKLTFDVIASDEKGEIGRGTHERFIVEIEKFMSKL